MPARLPGCVRQRSTDHRDGLWHWEDPSDTGVGVECIRKGALGRWFNSVWLIPIPCHCCLFGIYLFCFVDMVVLCHSWSCLVIASRSHGWSFSLLTNRPQTSERVSGGTLSVPFRAILRFWSRCLYEPCWTSLLRTSAASAKWAQATTRGSTSMPRGS